MARYRFLKFSALICALLFILPYQARADWKWDAVQITCDKDLNYFSLRTMALEDVRPKDTEAAKRIEQQSGIYDIGSLLKHPYTCNLPDYTIEQGKKFLARIITVEIANYQGEHEHGECATAATFDVIVKLNGTKIRLL